MRLLMKFLLCPGLPQLLCEQGVRPQLLWQLQFSVIPAISIGREFCQRLLHVINVPLQVNTKLIRRTQEEVTVWPGGGRCTTTNAQTNFTLNDMRKLCRIHIFTDGRYFWLFTQVFSVDWVWSSVHIQAAHNTRAENYFWGLECWALAFTAKQ